MISKQTVTAFLKHVGVSHSEWEGEPLNLTIGSRKIYLEECPRGLLLAQMNEITEYDSETLIPKALQAVNPEKQLPLPVQTGMRGRDKLAFLTTLEPEQLTLPAITEAIDLLDHLHQSIAE